MKTIRSTDNLSQLSKVEKLWFYNGLDSAITLEVRNKMPSLQDHIYAFERQLQAPLMEMSIRGIHINPLERQKNIKRIEDLLVDANRILGELTIPLQGTPLNAQSPKQIQHVLYEVLCISKQYEWKGGKKKVSTSRACLERIIKNYRTAKPICRLILSIRDLKKHLSSYQASTRGDGRLRSRFKIATETGRLAASKDDHGMGLNFQNQTEVVRRMFVADEGMELAYIDLEQAESRAVGIICWALFGDHAYIDACESEDLHTTVCRMVWPSLGWTGDIKDDRPIADKLFYRNFSYRDLSKRGGHGTNYHGQANTMAKHLSVTPDLIKNFQRLYFHAFPEIPKWHKHVSEIIQTEGELTTLFGRNRKIFSRVHDLTTLRKMIAFHPQSFVADWENYGMLNIWKKYPQVQLLAQVHDAVLIQYRREDRQKLLPQIRKEFEFNIQVASPSDEVRNFTIPTDCEVGYNWAHHDPKCWKFKDGNPDGLISYDKADFPKNIIGYDPASRNRTARQLMF